MTARVPIPEPIVVPPRAVDIVKMELGSIALKHLVPRLGETPRSKTRSAAKTLMAHVPTPGRMVVPTEAEDIVKTVPGCIDRRQVASEQEPAAGRAMAA